MELITSERAAKWLQLCAKPPAPPLPDWLSRDNQIFIAMMYAMRFERCEFAHAEYALWPHYFVFCEHTATPSGALYAYRGALDAAFTAARRTVTGGDATCDRVMHAALRVLLAATEPEPPNARPDDLHPLRSWVQRDVRDRLKAVLPPMVWFKTMRRAHVGAGWCALERQFYAFDKAKTQPSTALVASATDVKAAAAAVAPAGAAHCASAAAGSDVKCSPAAGAGAGAERRGGGAQPKSAAEWDDDESDAVAGARIGLAACPFRNAGCPFAYAKAYPERLQRHNIDAFAQHIVLLKVSAEQMEALCEPLAAVLLNRAEACPVCEKRPPFKAAKRISAQLQPQPPEQQPQQQPQQQRLTALAEHKLKPLSAALAAAARKS